MNNLKYRLFACFTIIFILCIIINEITLSSIYSNDINVNFNTKNNISANINNININNDYTVSGSNEILPQDNSNTLSGDIYSSGDFLEKLPIISTSPLAVTHQIKSSNGTSCTDFNLGPSEEFATAEGITTFRGNNYRDSAFYGNVSIKENKLTRVWSNTIGKTDNWTGVGWNGQPAIIKWTPEMKNQMNIYDKYKSGDKASTSLTEVIYGALDSKVHFYDLETGLPTREPIEVPSSIKGSVTIDPRGYPLLYVGQGIDKVSGENVQMGYRIFSLINSEELFFINGRDPFAYVGWGAFDGNPIIDAKTDTMILPGENGLIYIVKLNTNYNKELGTISILPQVTKYRTTINGKAGGIENSVAIYKNFAYFANNNGIIQCLNLNTLSPVWNFQMEDDCDATIGLEEENGGIMLYEACEVDRRKAAAPAVARKINGLTGKAIWEYSCDCLYDSNVNGGALSSVVIGKKDISDLVIFNFSKTTSYYNGKMVALDKKTGNVVWEKDLAKYSWSSPTAIYSDEGKAYIVFCNSVGQVMLIDARTGDIIYTLNTGAGNMEGSPAIFNNRLVIGTRGKRIICIEIS